MSSHDARRRLLQNARYEVVPLKSLNEQIQYLPNDASVSVTCSPQKGIEATLQLAAELQSRGHHAVPHIAARLVSGLDHVEKIAAIVTEHGMMELFVVGGDPDPVGPYSDGASLMRDLLPHCPTVRTVGFPSYPDHHVAIPEAALDEALLAKQALLAELGLEGFASTQMCFDAKKIERWLAGQRARGFVLPVQLGVPGVVERARLLSLGTRLGIGSSLRYLRKNTGAILRIFSPKSYDPNKLINPISRRADELNIVGLHLFTFNSIQSTAAWQAKSLL